MSEKFNDALKALIGAFLDDLAASDQHDVRLGVAEMILPPGYLIAKPDESIIVLSQPLTEEQLRTFALTSIENFERNNAALKKLKEIPH